MPAEVLVRALIAEQELPADEGELDRLVAAYLEQKQISEMLFAVEEARYESPALLFNPTPVFADWWQDSK